MSISCCCKLYKIKGNSAQTFYETRFSNSGNLSVIGFRLCCQGVSRILVLKHSNVLYYFQSFLV
ncbi:hypothetical protein Hanom_Chr08g00752141 [Helianthus anomalus]